MYEKKKDKSGVKYSDSFLDFPTHFSEVKKVCSIVSFKQNGARGKTTIQNIVYSRLVG
jgi:hypothetical protein